MLKLHVLRIVQVVLLLLLLSGCAVTNNFGPYMGKVVEAETGKPIEGAVVFMECGSLTGNLGGTQYHYIDAKEVLTDSKGEFYIELRVNTLRPGHAWEYPKFIIFKPGYGVYPGYPVASVDITIKDAPSFFPENQYVTIKLPKLQSNKDRKENMYNIDVISEVPFEKRQLLFNLENTERISIGFKPLSTPKLSR